MGRNRKLTKAWEVIDNYFQGMDAKQIDDFFDFIINKIEVVRIEISERIDPNSVFETLNARGRPLSNLDLIRNYFYSFFNESEDPNRRETVHSRLENARQQLREDRSEARSSDYMRCCLQCRFGFLPNDRLYREMKTCVNEAVGRKSVSHRANYIFDLVNELTTQEKIEIFGTLSRPIEADDIFSTFRKDMPPRWRRSKRSLFTLMNELKNYKVTRTIAFALLNLYIETSRGQPRKDAAKLVYSRLHSLNSFVMRTVFVARKFEPSHYEREFAELARLITSGGAQTLKSTPFRDKLSELDEHGVIDDDAFIQRLSETTMRDNTKAKRFLLGIARRQQSELVSIDDQKYTIEHILPESSNPLGRMCGIRSRGA